MSIYDDLEKLKRLLDEGAISKEEYEREKERIFAAGSYEKGNGMNLGMDDKTLVVLMHASQFLTSFILPLVLWLLFRDKSKLADEAGKKIINFQLSYLVYCIILCITCIGSVLVVFIGFAMIIFIIIAIVKAINGENWDYPLTIRFLK